MSVVLEPIHVEMIDGEMLRYFASPNLRATGRPDLAWHSCDDLWRILRFQDTARETVLRALRRDWKAATTIATADGPLVIQPHFMGEGIVEAVEEMVGDERPDIGKIRGGLRRGCTAASKAQVPHLNGSAYLAFHLAALAAHDPDE